MSDHAQNILNLLTAQEPDGIQRQETIGMRNLLVNESIPKEMYGVTREKLVELGFVFGEDVDDLFVNCTLPAGWKKQATSDPRHGELVDETGKVRACFFYKAAFYDRKADLSWRG